MKEVNFYFHLINWLSYFLQKAIAYRKQESPQWLWLRDTKCVPGISFSLREAEDSRIVGQNKSAYPEER